MRGSADELDRLLRKFRKLRRREERVLARLVRLLGGLPAPSGGAAVEAIQAQAVIAGAVGVEAVVAEAVAAAAVAAEAVVVEDVVADALIVETAPTAAAAIATASPAAATIDPSWTKGALSPFLLVVGDSAHVVALPWGAVRRVSLAEEEGVPLPPLRRWLNGGAHPVPVNGSNGQSNGHRSAVEPGYSVRWGNGASDGLVCESVGGIFPVGKAEERGVTLVLLPSLQGGVESVSLEAWVERLFPVSASPTRAKANGVSNGHAPAPVAEVAAPPKVAPEALVCVRNLPARVSLARALRLAGWRVTEEPDDEAGLLHWRRGSASRAYVELPSSPDASRIVESWAAVGGDLVLVGARAAPWEGQLPGALRSAARIVHPFGPGELEACVLPPSPAPASSEETAAVKAPPLPADR